MRWGKRKARGLKIAPNETNEKFDQLALTDLSVSCRPNCVVIRLCKYKYNCL